jgi:penicillin-binding protein 1A
MQAIGAKYAQDYIGRFGFDPKLHPAYLPMALGAGATTPLQMLGAYAIFANGGYRVTPYLIDRVIDSRGNVLSSARPVAATEGAERAIDPRNAFIITTMMRDVVRAGTAARAMQLGRQDLAGKTGTTNDNVDAWFCGFNASMVAIAWIGFDQPKTLGTNETGAVAALPIWINFMAKVLKGIPERPLQPPEGVIVARISPETGLREPEDRGGIPEYFYAEFPPKMREDALPAPAGSRTPGEIRNQLF